jgi:hypothetical protein
MFEVLWLCELRELNGKDIAIWIERGHEQAEWKLLGW